MAYTEGKIADSVAFTTTTDTRNKRVKIYFSSYLVSDLNVGSYQF